MISKGGTNDLHGSLYYFHRNDKLNARNFFSATREPFKGNDFGFSIGGPVYIPKVYNGKNKTFFFVLIGGIRERKEQRFNQIVPTLAQRTGDFSTSSKIILDPTTGQQFPGNVIPQSRIDPNAAAYMKMYPLRTSLIRPDEKGPLSRVGATIRMKRTSASIITSMTTIA